MSKAAFDKIASGLDEALSVARGQAMTPIEAAVKALREVELWDDERPVFFSEADARLLVSASITAFLEAAVKDRDSRRAVAMAVCLGDEGAKKAILALKEAVNG